MAVSNQFSVLITVEDPIELWVSFKCVMLKGAKCIGHHTSSSCGFALYETLENTEMNCSARLARNPRLLSQWHRPRSFLRRDKVRYAKEQFEDLGHMNANDLWPASQSLRNRYSKSAFHVNCIQTADSTSIRYGWVLELRDKYFQHLYMDSFPWLVCSGSC